MFNFHKGFLFVLLLLVGVTAHAQTSFSLTPSIVYAEKPKTNSVMYNYAALENLTGDSLHMRWVKTSASIATSGHGGGNDLGDWVIAVQDPSNWYNPANDLDSADFVLSPNASFTDKFILQLHPNNMAGNLVARFKLFPIYNPADSAFVLFDYLVTDAASAANGLNAETPSLSIYPNPASSDVWLHNTSDKALEVTWFSSDGKCHETARIPPGGTLREAVNNKASGQWQLLAKDGTGSQMAFPLMVAGQ